MTRSPRSRRSRSGRPPKAARPCSSAPASPASSCSRAFPYFAAIAMVVGSSVSGRRQDLPARVLLQRVYVLLVASVVVRAVMRELSCGPVRAGSRRTGRWSRLRRVGARSPSTGSFSWRSDRHWVNGSRSSQPFAVGSGPQSAARADGRTERRGTAVAPAERPRDGRGAADAKRERRAGRLAGPVTTSCVRSRSAGSVTRRVPTADGGQLEGGGAGPATATCTTWQRSRFGQAVPR